MTAADVAMAFAIAQVGKPYVWGAIGPNAYDCSGLCYTAYAHAGVSLHRTSYGMQNDGVEIQPGQELPGDLILPYSGHIFMYLGNNRIVEAPEPGKNVQFNTLYKVWKVRRVAAPGSPIGNLDPSLLTSEVSSTTSTATDTGLNIAGAFDAFKWITDVHNVERIGEVIMGSAMVGVGVYMLGSGGV